MKRSICNRLTRSAIGILAALAVMFTARPAVALGSSDKVQFNRDIRPILSNHCTQCHGPDKKDRKADLRLDTLQGAMKDNDGIKAIVPGNLDQSELYKRIVHTDVTERMPPKKFGKPLSPDQIDLLTRWISQGATWQDHWAFVPVTQPRPPAVKQKTWPRNPIDHFVLAKLESQGLKPSSEAAKTSLIRRVTLALTGLPPTISEIDAFLADKSPNAYEKVVDRLLDSPHYGENMTRYWLDAARYADTNGYQYDKERTQWAWRDWVINAYNTNMPFDQFTTEQIAGDLLPNATPAQKLATAFNRNHPITIEGGVIDEEYRTEYVVDRVVTMSTVWLGLTMVCSRCHEHKFDPISQQEFYQLFAFFNQVPERGLNGFEPRMKAPLVLQQGGGVKKLDQQIAALQAQYDSQVKQLAAKQAQWEKTAHTQSKSFWTIVTPTQTRSRGGAKLTLQSDKSVLAGGKNPAKDTYEITIMTELPNIRAVRLEALTHPSLPFKSASRGTNGNFVLSEFKMTEKPAAKLGGEKPVKFATARADYSQKGWEIPKAIDGNAGTGWAVDGNRFRVNRTAVFVTDKPVGHKTLKPGQDGTELRITMQFNYGGSHQIGRFRLALSSNPNADSSASVLDILAVPVQKRNAKQKQQIRDYFIAKHGPPQMRKILNDLKSLHSQRAQAAKGGPKTMIMAERPGMRKTHLLYRGEYDKPREQVQPGVPAAFAPMPKGAPANRLGLAKWIVAPSNPLTSRVIVNRYWQRYFGTGIVKTVEDFGTRAEAPSHPQLLDWLAAKFVRSGWNVKTMQKLIVTSAAYRQSSSISPSLLKLDPTNRLIARGPRLRLDAETIRDSVLSISGLLIDRLGGPSVYPYHPQGLWLEINNRPGYSKAYPHQKDPQHLYRRSLYTFWKRTVPPPSMSAFDAPEREFCVVSRSATNTPLQAFVLMNDPQFVEAARHLGKRIMTQGGKTFERRITYGLRLATARQPNATEIAIYKNLFQTRLAKFKKDPDAARKLLEVGASAHDTTLDLAEHAAWTSISRVILNLSETINKG